MKSKTTKSILVAPNLHTRLNIASRKNVHRLYHAKCIGCDLSHNFVLTPFLPFGGQKGLPIRGYKILHISI